MHFGLFVEEKRHEASQTSAFRDIFEVADRAEAWGIDCVWLGEIHFTPLRSVISASLQVASAIARAHPPAPRRDRGPGPPPEPSPAHRRRGRDRRSHQRRPLRVRHRPQRRGALVRHLWRALRREPGPLSRGARRSSGRRGRGSPSATRASSTGCRTPPWRRVPIGFRIRPFAWPPPARRRFRRRGAWDCPSSSGCAPPRLARPAGSARALPARLARGRPSRQSQRLSAHPRLRLDHRGGRARGAAREPHVVLRPPDRAGPGGGGPSRGRPRRAAPLSGRAHGQPLLRRRPRPRRSPSAPPPA